MIGKIIKKQEFILIFLSLCATFLLAACNSIANAESIRLEVEGLDTFQFTPNTASLPAEAEVELTFINGGKLDHNLIIAAERVAPFNLSEAAALAGINTGMVSGGEKKTISFNAPSVGTYTFACVVPGHAAAGMVGTLTITRP